MNGPLDEEVSNVTSIVRIPHASKHFYNFVYVMAIIAPFSFSVFELVLDVGFDGPRLSRSRFNRHSRVNPPEEVISGSVDPCSVGQSARRKGFFVVMEEVDDVVYEFLWKVIFIYNPSIAEQEAVEFSSSKMVRFYIIANIYMMPSNFLKIFYHVIIWNKCSKK